VIYKNLWRVVTKNVGGVCYGVTITKGQKMTIYVDFEVMENREFVKANPNNSRLVNTVLDSCKGDANCTNLNEIRSKDFGFITWYCPEHYHLATWAND